MTELDATWIRTGPVSERALEKLGYSGRLHHHSNVYHQPEHGLREPVDLYGLSQGQLVALIVLTEKRGSRTHPQAIHASYPIPLGPRRWHAQCASMRLSGASGARVSVKSAIINNACLLF